LLTKVTTFRGLGATALLIVVGVALDTIRQIQAQLMAKQYEHLIK
ncbi:MAG TPA: preprotein translocase subunit SecY, partial [Thermodesulfobium narugense]|nr:preprotein translocase subunit SecY [Thermodesulfobium narugense]